MIGVTYFINSTPKQIYFCNSLLQKQIILLYWHLPIAPCQYQETHDKTNVSYMHLICTQYVLSCIFISVY